MADIEYTKDYLPGYTGHVPKKNDIYGCTSGDINRILTHKAYKPSNYDVDIAVGKPQFAQRTFYSKPPETDVGTLRVQYTNMSKIGQNWIGGPTNNVKAQHVPGYQGYVPSIQSENLYGKSFARITGKAINSEFVKGVGLPVAEQFKTHATAEFSKDNFRRIIDNKPPADVRDQYLAENFTDAEFKGIEIERPNIYMEMPTVGYQGFQSKYRTTSVAINHRKDPFFNINPLRPRLQETHITQAKGFDTMTPGFQAALTSQKHRTDQGLPDSQDVQIPVAGYTGHRVAYRAQNFYGKNFRDCAIQSKLVQKMAA